MALATEHAEYILATAEHAQITEHLALVYVDARLLVTLVGVHEAHLALASKRSRIIEAVAIFAKSIVVGAFVYILASVAIPSEASVAIALRTSALQRDYHLLKLFPFGCTFDLTPIISFTK